MEVMWVNICLLCFLNLTYGCLAAYGYSFLAICPVVFRDALEKIVLYGPKVLTSKPEVLHHDHLELGSLYSVRDKMNEYITDTWSKENQ